MMMHQKEDPHKKMPQVTHEIVSKALHELVICLPL